LRFVARAGLRTHARVSVCGEMAAEPRALAVLIGLGLRELSMAPGAQGLARQLVTGLAARDARRLAREAVRPAEHTERRLAHAGLLRFETGEGDQLVQREMRPGDRVHVVPPTVHRMTAIEDCDIFEVSTPELDDVVRLEDRYGRTGTSAP